MSGSEKTRAQPWLFLGALNGGAAVALGAYGWHHLADNAPMREIFMLAVNYHMWHALALLAVAALSGAGARSRLLTAAGGLFMVGIVLFSGSLYLLAIAGKMPFPGAAPSGGGAWILGWTVFAWFGYRRMRGR